MGVKQLVFLSFMCFFQPQLPFFFNVNMLLVMLKIGQKEIYDIVANTLLFVDTFLSDYMSFYVYCMLIHFLIYIFFLQNYLSLFIVQ